MKRGKKLLLAVISAVWVTGLSGCAEQEVSLTASNDLFSITMPEETVGTYETDISESRITVYDKASKDAGFGGYAFDVAAYKNPDEYAGGMDKKIGEFTSADGTLYDIVVQYPSDVQYDYVTYADKMPESYERLYRGAEDILKTLTGTDGSGSFIWGAGTKGEELYGDVLAKYVQALKEKWDAQRLEKEDMSSMYYSIATEGGDVFDRVGYAYYDANYDGIEELFIGEIAEGDWKGTVYDIYTMVDREPAHVVSGWNRSRWYALSGGTIVNEYSEGAALSGLDIYDIEPNTANLLGQLKFKTDGYENEEQPWFISYDDGETWEPMTEEEYEERISNFSDYMRFDFAPFADVADYADEASWAYFGIGEGKAADLFLVCPTVDMNDEYNMSLDDEDTKESFIGALNMERGIYEDEARMYAPFYRQAAMKVYGLSREEWEPYMEIAYSDVSDAFAYYLEHENDGRPIILAGFSQGADMCYRLLEEYFGDEALYDQLVAVYAIGWPCSAEMTERYPQIVPATGETDTGVVISFDCEAPEVSETIINPVGEKAYCINPLNWRTDDAVVDRSENLGACFTDYSGAIKKEEPALCGCYIDEKRGVVKVTDINPEDYNPVIPGLPEGAYHIYDYQFFFRNLQKNVGDRLDSYTDQQSALAGYTGIHVESPDWVEKLDAAANAQQMFIVAAFSEDATDAWISLHEKDSDGKWYMVMTTPGFIGKNGLGKTKEGDAKTPVGTYHFNRAFGIADDPGCAIPYVKVDENTYWSGDGRDGYHYNELVSLNDLPDLATEDSERIMDYPYHYQYCLNISYNEDGIPGLGSAIFLHCFGPAKPFSGGCVAIPEDHMKYVIQHVDENTAVVIDTYEALSGTDEWPDSTWPQERAE